MQRSKSKPESFAHDSDDVLDQRLDHHSIITTSMPTHPPLKGVVQIVQRANSHMFEPMPERGGFNSTRIADILNFRKCLPTTATVAHVHALSISPTATEKEIAQLTRANVLRKIVIPGRDKLLQRLRSQPLSQRISPASFTASEISTLKRAGFLTSSIQCSSPSAHATTPIDPSTSFSTISRAASGPLAAIGGSGPVLEGGGTLGFRRSSSQFDPLSPTERASDLQLALPNTGPYLRLLTEARSHLISLIHKSGSFRQIPMYLLRERWDGGIAGDNPASRAKKLRGEFAGVLPARTRKWKHFWGLAFDWVLAQCVGGGMVELFETGSVGLGVRVT
ncbi:MAG: hypothetical protein LQ337_001002 [Flavoplaca oasis]|nr:MAG: hypothetical protein LQ337_001002 [Flavoplaca oasis]